MAHGVSAHAGSRGGSFHLCAHTGLQTGAGPGQSSAIHTGHHLSLSGMAEVDGTTAIGGVPAGLVDVGSGTGDHDRTGCTFYRRGVVAQQPDDRLTGRLLLCIDD